MTAVSTPPGFIPVSQFSDPTTVQDGLNCTSAAHCDLGLYATGERMWPGEFRRLQTDEIGGISNHDAAIAWQKAFPDARLTWASPLERGLPVPPGRVGSSISADRAWELLEAGYGFVVAGDYEVFDDAGLAIQPGFRDPHALFLVATRSVVRVGRQVYRVDPLGRSTYDGEWISWDLAVKYAVRFSGNGLIASWAARRPPETSTEDDVKYRFDIERWNIDGDPAKPVTTVGVPLKADGSPDWSRRLAILSDKGGANLRLEDYPRERLSGATVAQGVDPVLTTAIMRFVVPTDTDAKTARATALTQAGAIASGAAAEIAGLPR